jgi:ribosomal protein S2
VVAVCDTNIDGRQVQWPIAGNDDASKAIALMTNLIAEAVSEGKAHPVVAPTQPVAAAPVAAAEPEVAAVEA